MERSEFKSGFVTIIGRPNVGKSTLLNALIKEKVSIISAVPQTTRHQIKGILNTKAAQIVFVDTPGIHSFKDPLALKLNSVAKSSLEGCDLLLYVVDTSRKVGLEEEAIIDFLLNCPIKIIMVFNKVDIGAKHIDSYVRLWKEKLTQKQINKDPVVYYLPVSAKTGKNIDTLIKSIIEELPQGSAFYDTAIKTDFPLKLRIADLIREKLFLVLKKELPHSIAVEIEEIEEKGKITYIRSLIYVNRPSQKKIVIGDKGNVLKQVGQVSRKDIEAILNKKVYLNIWVKVAEDWQRSPRILEELGYV